MPIKLNFTHSTTTLPVVPSASVNKRQFISSIPDPMDQRLRASEGIVDGLSRAWNAVVNCFKRLWECLCGKKKIESSSPEEIDRRRVLRERELAVWQAQMAVNLKQNAGTPFVDLSGRLAAPGYCSALGFERIPQIGHYAQGYPMLERFLSVKLPARQLHCFPQAIKNELSNYDADHLDVYFMIWRDIPRIAENAREQGKRNLIYHPMAYPNAQDGETHYHDLSMGIFDSEGIEAHRGHQYSAMPFNHFGLQNVHIHPRQDPGGMGMCTSPDAARFHLPHDRDWSSFNSSCKFPDGRAAAVFGVILNSSSLNRQTHLALNPLYRDRISLQEYKTEIQNGQLDPRLKAKIAHVLDFYTDR